MLFLEARDKDKLPVPPEDKIEYELANRYMILSVKPSDLPPLLNAPYPCS